MNESEAINIIQRTKATWPNFKVIEDTDLLIEVYMDWLGEFSYAQVQDAIKTFKGERFAPGPAEILAVLQPTVDLGEAWMARPYGEVNFFSPKTADTPEGVEPSGA